MRVFVTGLGAVTSVGLTREATWEALVNGVSGVDYIESFDPTGFETRVAAEVKKFDPSDYMDKKEARRLDRFSQLGTVAALEALRHAELDLTTVDRTRVAIVLGSGVGGLITLSQQVSVLVEKGPKRVNPFLVPMMLADMAPANLSIKLGILGPNFTTVSSCSSGAEALGISLNMLQQGTADIIISGGSEAPICPIGIAGFNACQALSRRNDDPKGASRPFDIGRDGFVMGEGAGVLVLESHASVLRRGVKPLAEFVGYAATSDAFHITQPAPNGEGAARAIESALAKAQLSPTDVDYINAHGTSTLLNDKLETEAVKKVFGEGAYRIPVSSTKSMTGHLLGAAPALEAALCVMAIARGVIPPTINLEEPDPACDLDYTPFLPRRGRIKVSISNSLGFGGHNAVLVFREINHI